MLCVGENISVRIDYTRKFDNYNNDREEKNFSNKRGLYQSEIICLREIPSIFNNTILINHIILTKSSEDMKSTPPN